VDRITENETDFNTLEQWCYDMGMAFARKLMLLILGNLDDEILKTRDKAVYRSKGFRTMTLKTLMGEVELPRRLYQTKTGTGERRHRYLLDEAIDLSTIGKISMGLVSRITETITESSYRATATAISHMTGQAISHTGVWNVVQETGEQLREQDHKRGEAVKQCSGTGTKTVKALQEEFDGVWIHMQGKDRPKKKGSRGSREMKLACAYEGVRFKGMDKNKEPLYGLVNPVYTSGFEKAADFYEKKEGQLGSRYQLDEIQVRLLNGDGGGWVKGFGEKSGETVYQQLDPFHIQKAIKRSKLPKAAQERIGTLWEAKKIPTLLRYLNLYVCKEIQGKKPGEKPGAIETLHQYLNQNRANLIPIHERELTLPELGNDLLYGHMGAMESSVCGVIALRMKKRRASFTIEGASNLGSLLCHKRNMELEESIFSLGGMKLPMPMEEIITNVLSAAQAPKKEGMGYQYPVMGGMPFEQSFITNGRRAVQYAAGYHW